MEEKKITITFTSKETPSGTELCTTLDFENEPNTDHMMAAVHSLIKTIAKKVGRDPYRVAAVSVIAGEHAATALEKGISGGRDEWGSDNHDR